MADRILRELTPLETVQEADALRDYLQNMNLKNEVRGVHGSKFCRLTYL